MVKILNVDASKYNELIQEGLKCTEIGSDEDTVSITFDTGIVKINLGCKCISIDQSGHIYTLDNTEFYKVEIV